MTTVRNVGPYVGAAVLCRRADRQPDDSTDLVGLVDTHFLHSPFLDRVDPETVSLTAVIVLRAGDLRGDFTLALRAYYPSGVAGPMFARLIRFTDAVPSQTFLVSICIELEELGTCWFDVLFDQRRLTRIPLVVRPLRTIDGL